jgi:hypothetical protein
VAPRGRVLAISGTPRNAERPKPAIIQAGTYIIPQASQNGAVTVKILITALLPLLLMTFKDILSPPTIMVQVCTRAFTDFCHNHLAIQIHHAHKSHALDTERVESSSGPARTHPRLADLKPTIVGPRVEHKDEFTCKGGVDAGRLVNLARKSLYSTAKEMGGNVLLEEKSAQSVSLSYSLLTYVIRWDCEIRHPRSQRRDQFKVTVSVLSRPVSISTKIDPSQ